MEHLKVILKDQKTFSDVFVGGGSVLLQVAKQYPNLQLFANDKDQTVSSFWKIVSDPDTTQLQELLRLMSAQPTIDLFFQLRVEEAKNEVEQAYRCIFFNRTAFSGIANSGPIGGKEQKSKYTVDCRYNFKKLSAKILECHKLLQGRTQVENVDFADYLFLTMTNEPAYLDPPYYVKGNILYPEMMQPKEHDKLAGILWLRDNWVLSYDDCPPVRALYKDKKIYDKSVRYCINGKKEDWKNKNELIITSE
jgi:DNA adenine methylase